MEAKLIKATKKYKVNYISLGASSKFRKCFIKPKLSARTSLEAMSNFWQHRLLVRRQMADRNNLMNEKPVVPDLLPIAFSISHFDKTFRKKWFRLGENIFPLFMHWPDRYMRIMSSRLDIDPITVIGSGQCTIKRYPWTRWC